MNSCEGCKTLSTMEVDKKEKKLLQDSLFLVVLQCFEETCQIALG
jgi:hypothetical protein